jgi:hypothetical protein
MRLKRVNKKIMCVVDFWLDNIVVGYITKYIVNTLNCYIIEKKDFLKGPRKRYII